MLQHLETRRLRAPRAFILALFALLNAKVAHALQAGCPDPEFVQAWVDPLYGDDLTGAIDDPQRPYATLNKAIFVLSHLPQGTLDANRQGLVHALPGIYTNDAPQARAQSFPIDMAPFVHVQGVGAKECVLRVRNGLPYANQRPAYWPLATGLIRNQQATIAVDFSAQDEIEIPSRFEGFTIQGADIQVYAHTEVRERSGVVANCVFDMRDAGDEALVGPYFGALFATVYFGESVHGEEVRAYYDMPFFLFNNTFLHGVRYGVGEDFDASRPDSVAICNVNDPAPPCIAPPCYQDPNLTIRGVSKLHIQNNLIRALNVAPRTAMLGIDRGDTSVIVSSRPGQYDTNAFDSTKVGGVSFPTGMFASAIDFGAPTLAQIPLPVLDLADFPAGTIGPDPGFVGEFNSSLSSPHRRVRDARLLPDSALVDLGASPQWDLDGCAKFVAENLLSYDNINRDSPLSCFDFDGNGHGNPRIVGDDIDIGFDEVNWAMSTGSYGNDTKSHNFPYDMGAGVDSFGVPYIPTGSLVRDLILKAPTVFLHVSNTVALDLPSEPWISTGGRTHMPGSVAFPLSEYAPGQPLPLPGVTTWLDVLGIFTGVIAPPYDAPPAELVGTFSTSVIPWANSESGQLHLPNVFEWTWDETALAPSHFAVELWVVDLATGQPVVVSTNLMTEYR